MILLGEWWSWIGVGGGVNILSTFLLYHILHVLYFLFLPWFPGNTYKEPMKKVIFWFPCHPVLFWNTIHEWFLHHLLHILSELLWGTLWRNSAFWFPCHSTLFWKAVNELFSQHLLHILPKSICKEGTCLYNHRCMWHSTIFISKNFTDT